MRSETNVNGILESIGHELEEALIDVCKVINEVLKEEMNKFYFTSLKTVMYYKDEQSSTIGYYSRVEGCDDREIKVELSCGKVDVFVIDEAFGIEVTCKDMLDAIKVSSYLISQVL